MRVASISKYMFQLSAYKNIITFLGSFHQHRWGYLDHDTLCKQHNIIIIMQMGGCAGIWMIRHETPLPSMTTPLIHMHMYAHEHANDNKINP